MGDLYRRLSAHRTAIKLVDRCAPEFPELRQVWFEEGRAVQVGAVAQYLRRRAESGDLVVLGRAVRPDRRPTGRTQRTTGDPT